MARTAQRVIRQAAFAGLLGATACAVMQVPPGGPPDFDPPVLLSVTPDSGTVADSLEDPLVFQFDEVVSEQSGGGIENLFELYPQTPELVEQVDVDWRRNAVAVRPTGGWQPNLVYQVTLLPGIADLRNNRLDESRTVIFSTGGPIPDTRVSGILLDWENGKVGVGAIVQATLLPDSLTYSTTVDSAGEYVLTALPVGTYLLTGAVDANRNGRRERLEPFDTVTMTVDGQSEHTFWAVTQDTIGPQLRGAESLDSITIRLQFDQKLEPGDPSLVSFAVWELPDTVPVGIAAAFTATAFDSILTTERVVRDSLARLEQDSLAALADTLDTPVDTSDVAEPTVSAPEIAQDTIPPLPAELLLRQRPALFDRLILRLTVPMAPEARFLIDATVRNVIQAEATSRRLLIVPALPDST